jgi:uncharacterized protein (DUF2235 family)
LPLPGTYWSDWQLSLLYAKATVTHREKYGARAIAWSDVCFKEAGLKTFEKIFDASLSVGYVYQPVGVSIHRNFGIVRGAKQAETV